jgi:hypothetical protein
MALVMPIDKVAVAFRSSSLPIGSCLVSNRGAGLKWDPIGARTTMKSLNDLFQLLRGQFINISTDNPLSWVYVILNSLLLILAWVVSGGSIDITNLFGGGL